MTIEEAVRALVDGDLHLEHQTGLDETNFTVRGDWGPFGEREFYRWECWLSKRESECIVEPPPHLANTQPLGFVVRDLDEAVSLILYMYQRRLQEYLPLDEKRYQEETGYTQRLYDEWLVSRT